MISVLVPYRPDAGHRERTWKWLAARYRALLPDVELIVEADDGGANPGEFNHPLAINRAAARAAGSVLLVADCDTAFSPHWIRLAAELVDSGRAPWILPTQYVKVDASSSAEILKRPPSDDLRGYGSEWIGESVSVAGLVVVPAHAFHECGGYDERFTKWGSDDVCFAVTMDTLHGSHVRLPGAALHLWHPTPLGETYGHDQHRRQYALAERYKAAAGNPDAIRGVRFQ